MQVVVTNCLPTIHSKAQDRTGQDTLTMSQLPPGADDDERSLTEQFQVPAQNVDIVRLGLPGYA